MLELKHIKKSFDGVPVLRDINLEIDSGEIVSILGPSGCGKTTLLNIILGLTQADAGEMRFDEEDILHVPMEERGFNIVFQDYALFPNLNVQQNVTYGLRNKKDIATAKEVSGLIELLGLKEHLGKKIEQLSGGQKQRVALARTMVIKPKILLLDEPLSALDGVIKESIKSKIKEIAREYHLTTIIVTHDPEEALTLSDKVCIMNQGTIAQYGRPEDIINAPEEEFVKTFILKQLEIKGIYIVALIVFLAFLFVPLVVLFRQALEGDGGVTLANFGEMLSQKGFGTAVANSMSVSVTSAVAATLLAFLLAYTIHYTNAPRPYKKFIRLAAQLPMLLPTITYGFAIIYSFGKQGLLTRLFGRQLFDIYGFNGLVIGYVICT